MKYVKKFFFMALFILSFFSCEKNKKEEVKVVSALERIRQRGYISVATSPDLPPFEYLVSEKTIAGIEIEIVAKIAEELGVKLRLVNLSFDSIIPEIQLGKYDLGVSGFSITEDRARSVLFSMPHSVAGLKVITLDNSDLQHIDNLSGLTIAVQDSSTGDMYCKANGLKALTYRTNHEALDSVVNGEADAWIIDNLAGSSMVGDFNSSTSSEQKLKILQGMLTYEEYAFVTSMNNEDLIVEINKSLRKLKDDGTIERIFKKYNTVYTKTKDYIL